jgi:K+ transporter
LDNGFHEIEPGLWSGDWYYEHYPNFKKEQEAKKKKQQAKRKSVSLEEVMEKNKKKRRAELLDEIYCSENSYNQACARMELNTLDGIEFRCPVCNLNYVSQKNVDEHLETMTGKGHKRYRAQHGIQMKGQDTRERFHPEEIKVTAQQASKLKSNQADIRSFFKPKAGSK